MKTAVRLLVLAGSVWPALAAAVACVAVTVGANIGLMFSAAYLISAAALQPPLAALSPAIVGVRFFTLVRATARYLERYAAHDAVLRLLSHLRGWFYNALEPLAPARVEQLGGAELLERAVGHIETLQHFFLRMVVPPTAAAVVLAGGVFLLAWYGPGLGWPLAVAFLGIGVVLPSAFHRLGRGLGLAVLDNRGRLGALMADSVHGLRELAAFGQTGRQLKRAADVDGALTRAQGRSAAWSAAADATGSFFAAMTAAAVLVMAIPLVSSGRLDGVYLAGLALAAQAACEAVLPLAGAGRHWEEGVTAARRLFIVGDAIPGVVEPQEPAAPPATFDLEVSDLSFRYHPESPAALTGISFTLPAGKRLAVVGPSGAGKSTLAALLLRFRDYQSGSIRLGGIELKDYRAGTVREIISLIPQNPHIFNATVGDNIRLASPRADEAAVAEAAAGAALQTLAGGLAAWAGEEGAALSGGERQRVAIARVLLANPAILIMDEPAANLDAVTEQEVMAAIRQAMGGRSVLLITHRLTGLEEMDEILVLDGGRVVERGRYDELLAGRGLFYEMWRLQQDVFLKE